MLVFADSRLKFEEYVERRREGEVVMAHPVRENEMLARMFLILGSEVCWNGPQGCVTKWKKCGP